MKIKVSFELNMTDKDIKAWANEYGLDLAEVSSDATRHLGELVREHVAQIHHVQEFATIQNYQAR